MRKLSIVLIAFLIFTTALPYNVFADNSVKGDSDSNEPSVDQEIDEDESSADGESSGKDAEAEGPDGDSSGDGKNSDDEVSEDGATKEDKPEKGEPQEGVTENDAPEDDTATGNETDPQAEPEDSSDQGTNSDNGQQKSGDQNRNEQGEKDDEKQETEDEQQEPGITPFQAPDGSGEPGSEDDNDAIEKNKTSKLGHLKSDATIYEEIGGEPNSSDDYLNAVYYIKKQAEVIYQDQDKKQLYYLISTEPSSEDGVIGWVKEDDLSTQSHKAADKDDKTFIFKGTGEAYTKAWGGSEDLVYDLSNYEDHVFNVHKTETVGSNVWYRGDFNGERIWVHESYVMELEESKTSRLGHLRSDSTIYGPDATFSSEDYQNAVYYIKKQGETGDQVYYLISTEPSSEEGVVGWVKADDMSTHSHVGVDKNNKSFIIKGTGNAFTKAWGGSKDHVYDLSNYENQEFEVHLTEKVGKNVWYRGNLHGETVWMHNSYVTEVETSKTSKLGHLRTGSTIYEEIGDESTSFSSEDYLNAVYYIKQQAEANGGTYYLISQQPSSEEGVVGWVNADDMSTHPHVGVDKYSKLYYIGGDGTAYSKAWGGSKDVVFEDMSEYQYAEFEVNLTEKVGNNIWFRGELDGETVWLHESYVITTEVEEELTSNLGHIRSSNVKIYETIGYGPSAFEAGDEYTNAVYYIKKQAEADGQLYYLISEQASSEEGVIGWVKAEDMSTHPHQGVDREDKTFAFTGEGNAYSKAWGGSKDLVYELSDYEGDVFNVHKTETVGNNTWYRGDFNGERIWAHESYVSELEESKTSKLGHLRSGSTIHGPEGSFSSEDYQNAVYYIKKQAEANGQEYYLISTEPEEGVIGWVKADEMSTHPHKGIDRQDKTFFFKGTGTAYTKAWGGSKDLVYDLSDYEGEVFNVHLTEKVGSNTWYRGDFNGERIFVHESYLDKDDITNYDITLDNMVDLQMDASPQTDNQYKLWIREDAFESIENGEGKIEDGDVWNIRRGPGLDHEVGTQVEGGTHEILDTSSKDSEGYVWYHIDYTSGWVTPSEEDLGYYLDPSNFIDDFRGSLQFLELSEADNIADSDIPIINENILKDQGVLAGKAAKFVEAGVNHGINSAYLVSHALLETGNGDSELATGIDVGLDENGNPQRVTSENKDDLTDIKTTHNIYGIGAVDGCAKKCGSERAYEEEWFSVDNAIVGGAEFASDGYIQSGQDTLYEMRWNPEFAANNGYASHQYATDIGWAYKQTYNMSRIYNLVEGYSLLFDVPQYK